METAPQPLDYVARALPEVAAGAVLFRAGGLAVAAMAPAEVPQLQSFYEANPGYHRLVGGAAPAPDEARRDFEARPPADWALGGKWMLLGRDAEGRVAAVVDVLEDLFAPGIWCVGFFMVAERLHGTGAAAALHEGLVGWMRERGARWSRLGVVDANERALRFWRARGYRLLRLRHDYPVGRLSHTLHVLALPLHDAPDWDAYRRLVPRDDPATTRVG